MSKIIRSHTRKVVFCYIYMKIFGLLYNNQATSKSNITDDVFWSDDKDFLTSIINTDDIDTTNRFKYNFDDIEDDINFISDGSYVSVEHLDSEFIDKILWWFESWYDEIANILSPYLDKFGYHDMDIIKQSLFLLAYLEHKYIVTTPSIIINETVELAKLYWSPDVYKIINGVLHNYFNS